MIQRYLSLILFLFLSSSLYAENINHETGVSADDAVFEYEEVPVTVKMSRSWEFDSWILMMKDDNFFINIEELFKNLEIEYETSEDGFGATGFIERENRQFVINFKSKTIRLDGITHHLSDESLVEMGYLHISSASLERIFGISAEFSIRDLSLKLKANFELPRFKEMRLQQMRHNLSKLKGEEFNPDTVVARQYHFYRAGMLDWDFYATQSTRGNITNTLALDWGSEFLFGKMRVRTILPDRAKFVPQELYYDWHWVNNDNKIIRQIKMGKYANGEVGVPTDILGGLITNRSTTIRKATGSYELSDHTEPNWTVELYINGKLVDYTVADAAGLYTFEVPIIYGSTSIKIKTYGPSGEEREEMHNVKTPYSLMALHTFEYGIAGGLVPVDSVKTGNYLTEEYSYLKNENLAKSPKYAVANMLFGLTRKLTIGGGLEYSSSLKHFKYSNYPVYDMFVPFGHFTCQPFSIMQIHGKYSYANRLSGSMNLNLPAKINISLGYIRFIEPERSILEKPLDEKRAAISKSYSGDTFSGSIRAAYNQVLSYGNSSVHNLTTSLSNSIKRFSSNISLTGQKNDSLFTKLGALSLSYGLKSGLKISGNTSYDFDDEDFIQANVGLNTKIGKGRLSTRYSRLFSSKSNSYSLNYSHDFKIVRTNFRSSYIGEHVRFSESLGGSFAFAGDGHVKVDNRSVVDKSGITFYPFFDMNYNNQLDSGEKKLNTPLLKKNYYKTEINSLSRIGPVDLYSTHEVTFDDADLEYIGWQFPYKKFEIKVDPNQYKKVNVPIQVFGEVTGTIRGVPEYKWVSRSADTTLDFFYDDWEAPKPDYATLEILNYDVGNPVNYSDVFTKYKYIIEHSPDAIIRINTPRPTFEEPEGVLARFMREILYGLHVEQTQKWAKNIEEYLENVYDIPDENVVIGTTRDSVLYNHERFKLYSGKIVSISVTNALKIPLGTAITTDDTYQTINDRETLVGMNAGVIIQIFNKEGEKVGETTTESGGYFSYLGLRPGEYTIKVSEKQLERLNMKLYPDSHSVKINVSREGDYITDNDFIMINNDMIRNRKQREEVEL